MSAYAAQDPLQTIVLEDTISYAFLVLLDRLTPIERAVFVLREAFEFEYQEIAEFINKSEPACRKIYSRLKRKIQEDRPVAYNGSPRFDKLVLQFLHAASTGNMEGLLQLLSEDIVLYSDGGGRVTAAVKPIFSSSRVLAFIQGMAAKGDLSSSIRLIKVNGQLGFVLSGPNEPFPTVVSLDIRNDRIQTIFLIRNPDKLEHLRFG